MILSLAEKLPAFFRGRVGLTLVGLAGASLTLTIAFALRQTESQGIRQEFERRADLRYELLRANLREYDGALFALRLLVENSQTLSPEEFEQAARRLSARIGGIQAVQWVPLIPNAQLEAFTAASRALIDPAFTPFERVENTRRPITLPSPREEHALIAYVYPRAGNEASLGYDIFTAPSEPTLRRARGLPGVFSLSKPFPLVQGGNGVVFCVFVDRPDRASTLPPQAGPGFLQIVLRLDAASSEFFRFSHRPVLATLVLDVTDPEPTPIYLRHAEAPAADVLPSAIPPGFDVSPSFISDLPVGGRLWRVCFRPNPVWVASRRSPAPLLTLLGGGLLTILSVSYLNSIGRQTRRVRREVEQRTAELNESRALLDEIIDHNPSTIWVKDTAFRYQLVNLSFAASYGRARADILGRTDAGLHPADTVSRMEQLDARILATGETVSFEDTYRMPAGRRTYLVSKFPVRRADGTICAVAGIATDITELRESEAKQRAIERKLQDTQKLESLGLLAGGVAHDFNNLLTGILGHANLVRLQLPADSAVQTSLAQIETASQRAAELCRQMLAYSGRGRFAVQPAELGELVRETTALLKLSLARRARLHFDLAPGLPPVVADLTQIRQIVMNLVINASEALPDGTGDITLRTRLVHADAALFSSCVLSPELPPGEYVCLEVLDNGGGMPPATLERIFDPFFTTKFTGRGLGLAAVLGIVRGHHGALKVESEPGRGTVFRVYFPAAAAAVCAEPRPEHAPPQPSGSAGMLRLLLVDDEPAVRETAAHLLSSCGYTVDACADGETALRLFSAAPEAHHAAIIDLTMPGLGGAQLLRRLRERRPDLPVLVISGYTEQESIAADLLSARRVAFLAKPFTLAALRAKLGKLLQPDDDAQNSGSS